MDQFPVSRTMNLEEWYTVPDNPVQRDTKQHADRAVRKHLKDTASSQWVVQMATLPDGRCFKLDGHTRSLLWEEGRLPAPDRVLVNVHPCRNIEEVKALYSTFDNKGAGENAPDQVYGGFRLHGISPESSLFKKCMLATVMRTLPNPGSDLYDHIGNWKKEITAFDGADPVYGPLYPSGVVAGALATFRRHPGPASEFWGGFQSDNGWKTGTTRDGIQALREYIPQRRASVNKDSTAEVYDLACRVISAFESWRLNRRYKSLRIRRTDLREYIGGKGDQKKPQREAQ